MLIRVCAVPIIAALLIGLAPPLAGEATAAAPRWTTRLAKDYVEARRVTRGQGVKIALLSDGAAPGVRTLAGALVKGRDFVGTPRPKRLHGTVMASLIVGGGSTSGALGIRGLASGATLMPVRVYAGPEDPGQRSWWAKDVLDDTIARGIRHAVDNGAQVIAVEVWAYESNSAQIGGAIQAAVAHARRKNAVVVAATGTYGQNDPGYPAAAAGVLGIGGADIKGRRYKKGTGATTTIGVAAPAFNHIAIGPGNQPYQVWGTSVAVTWGASVAAMIKSEYPKLTSAQVVEAITASARHPKGKGRYDTQLGFGYINANGALNKARAISGRSPASATTPPPDVQNAAHFGGREAPGPVRAVPYDPVILGGFGGVMFAGLVAIVLGVWVALRRPRRRPELAPPGPDEPESVGASGP